MLKIDPKKNLLKYSSRYFSISMKVNQKHSFIDFRMFTKSFSTKNFPNTISILKSFVPSILNCRCRNQNKNKFSAEVLNTEIGHLFEHILLEFLCDEKYLKIQDDVRFRGETVWNWIKNKPGTFSILINSGKGDFDIILKSLRKSIYVLNLILLGSSGMGSGPKIPQTYFSN